VTSPTDPFRAEVRDWLRSHVPAGPLPSVDTAEGFARHRDWSFQAVKHRPRRADARHRARVMAALAAGGEAAWN
jgi:hypothetical protein